MTDQPTNVPEPLRSQDERAPSTHSAVVSTAPAANSIIGDPVRHDIGDKPEVVPTAPELPMGDAKSTPSGDSRRYTPSASDSGEGHKGSSGSTPSKPEDSAPATTPKSPSRPVDPAPLRTHPNQRMPQDRPTVTNPGQGTPSKPGAQPGGAKSAH